MWYRYRPVKKFRAIALARVLTHQYLFRPAIVGRAKLYKLYMLSLSHANTSATGLNYPSANNSYATSW